ncbi:hypothetical protein TruAng_005851 [Truncatella angustata]|nr:hypothetical protein TruAng_005851 [Truncatella angustata]
MNWLALIVVALAAPVWSHNHRHQHKRRACSTTQAAVAAAYAVEKIDAVQTSQVVQTTATYAAQTTVRTTVKTSVRTSAAQASAVQVTATYAVQTSQTTESASATSAASTDNTPARAIWLWSSDLLQDDTKVTEFLSFAESNEINSVYTLIDRDMGDEVFVSFIAQCNASGIAVEALMGNAQWITGGGDPTLESQLNWLEQYQGNASAESQFSAIHMDVEPWGLDGWTTNTETYTSALQSIVTQVKTLGEALGLPVVADLPYWAYTIECPTTGQTLDSWMLNNLDSAVFMTYRNTAAELLDIATKALEAGNTAGKPVWLAVETVDAADSLLISYYSKTKSALFEDLVSIKTTASSHSSFAGIAIHDYDGVVALGS